MMLNPDYRKKQYKGSFEALYLNYFKLCSLYQKLLNLMNTIEEP